MFIQDVVLKVKTVSANSLTSTGRAAVSFGIIATVVLPFVLLALGGRGTSHLPWYVWTIVLLLLLLAIGRGRYLFLMDSREAEAISIRPNHR